MSSPNSWERWKNIILKWVNCLNLQENRQTSFKGLEDGELFKIIITDLLKIRTEHSSLPKKNIQSFLRVEYPDVQLKSSTNEHQLILLASLLLYHWSMRTEDHKLREDVFAQFDSYSESAVHHFLVQLMPRTITNEALIETIESLPQGSNPSEIQTFPTTPCSHKYMASSRCAGSLKKFFSSPAARHQKLLTERQRELRELRVELDQEQSDKIELELKFRKECSKTHKLDAQLKAKSDEVAKLEALISKLQEDDSCRNSTDQVKTLQAEIKSLNLYVDELGLKYEPIEDHNIELRNKCGILQDALTLSEVKANDKEVSLAQLLLDIQTKESLIEELQIRCKYQDEYIKEMRNDGNISTDCDTSWTPASMHLSSSPMPLIDSLPLSHTVIDLQLREKQSEIDQLQANIDTASEKIAHIFSANEAVCPVDGSILLHLDTLECMLNQSKIKLAENVEHINNLSGELLKSQSEVESLLVRCDSYYAKESEMMDQITLKNEEIVYFKHEQEHWHNELSMLKQKKIQQYKVHQQLQVKLLKTEGQVETLKLQSLESDRNADQLQKTIIEKTEEISVLSREQENLHQALEDMKIDLAEKECQINQLAENCDDLNSKLNLVVDERSKLDEAYRSQESELKQAMALVASLESRCETYDEQVAEMNQVVNKKNEEISVAEQQRAKLSHELSVLTEKEIQLNDSLQLSETERVNAQEQVELLKLSCLEHEKKTAELKEIVDKKTEEISVLTSKQENLHQALEDLKIEVAKKECQINQLTENCDDLNSKLNLVVDQRSKLDEAYHSQKSDLKKAQLLVESLESRCNTYDEQVAEMNQVVNKKNEEISVAEQQREKLSHELSVLTEKESQLKDSLQLSKTECVEAQEQVESLKLSCVEHQKKTAKLEGIVDKKTGEISVLSREQENLHQALEGIKIEVAKKECQINQLTKNCEDLNSKLNLVVDQRSKLDEAYHSQESKLKKAQALVESLESRCETYDEQVADINQVVNKKNEEISVAEQQRAKLSQELSVLKEKEIQLKDSLQLSETERVKTQEQVESLKLSYVQHEEKIDELEETVAGKIEELAAMFSKQEDLHQTLEEVRVELAEKECKNEKLSEKCTDLNTQLNLVVDQRGKLDEAYWAQESELKKAQSLVESLESRCETYDEQVVEMNQAVNKKNEEISVAEQQREKISHELSVLTEKESQLKDSLQLSATERVKTQEQVESLKLSCVEHEKKTAELEGIVDKKTGEISVLVKEQENLHQALEDMIIEVAKKECQIIKLTENCDDLNSKLNLVVDQRSKLDEAYRSQESELKKAQLLVESQESRCKTYDEQVAEMNQVVNKRNEEISVGEQQRAKLSHELSVLTEKEIQLKASLQLSETERVNAQEQVESLKLSCVQHEEKTAELEEAVVGKIEALAVMSSKQEDLHQTLEDIKIDVAEKECQINQLTKNCDDLNTQFNLVVDQQSKIDEAYHSQKSDLKKAQLLVESLESRCETYDEQVAEMNQVVNKKNEEISVSEQQREKLSHELSVLTEKEMQLQDSLQLSATERVKTQEEVESLKLSCVQHEEKTTELEETVVGKSEELAAMSSKHEDLHQALEGVRVELAEKECENEKRTEKCTDLNAQLNLVVDQQSKLNEAYHSQKSDLKKAQSLVESLESRCDTYDEQVAEMNEIIQKKNEEIAISCQKREELSHKLSVLKEKEIQLKDSLQVCEMERVNAHEQVESLKLSCADHEKKTTELENAIHAREEELTLMASKRDDLCQQFNGTKEALTELEVQLNAVNIDLVLAAENLKAVTEERDGFSSLLNEVKNDLEEEKTKFISEMTAGSDKMTAMSLAIEKYSQHDDSFLGDCIQHVCNILALYEVFESDEITLFIADSNQVDTKRMKLSNLITKTEEKCKMYFKNFAEMKSAVESSEDSWKKIVEELKVELSSLADREKISAEANVAHVEQANAAEVSLVAKCKELCDKINDLSNLIKSGDNSVENSSVLSVSLSLTDAGSFEQVQLKLRLLQDSISLLLNNKTHLYDEFGVLKQQYVEKLEECQSLVSQVDTLTLSCNEVKAENLRVESLVADAERALDVNHIEKENWKKDFSVMEEKFVLMEQKLVTITAERSSLKIQGQALLLRNQELLAELRKKLQDCHKWDKLCREITSFKKAFGDRMEYFLSCRKQLDVHLSKSRSNFDDLNSRGLVDTADVVEIKSLKSKVSSLLSSVEEKYNVVSFDLLDCICSSLNYPYLLVQQHHHGIYGDSALTNPSISEEHHKALALQIEQIQAAMEGMLTEVTDIPAKINELEGNCLSPRSTTSDHSFLDDSLEDKPTSTVLSSRSKDISAPPTFGAKFVHPEDLNSVAVQNVMENIVVSQFQQFKRLTELKNETESLDRRNKLGSNEIKKAEDCIKTLETKITEQQNSAAQLQAAYTTLLDQCEHAQNEATKFRALSVQKEEITRQEQERTKQLEARTKQMEEEMTLRFTEEQVEKKVEKLGTEYQEKLERMKAKMSDLYRKETAKFDGLKVNACEETEKRCKTQHENEIKKYKIYVKDISHENSVLKERLLKEQMEADFLTKQMARLENRIDSRNAAVSALMGKNDNVMEHLQQRAEPKRVVHIRTLTATSTAIENDADSSASYYRRPSISTHKSVTSLHSIPSETFTAEDEEGEVFNNTYLGDLKAGHLRLPGLNSTERLGELQYRNSLCPPHLKSSYPAETQFHDPHAFRDEEVKLGFGLMDQSDTSSLNALLLPGERQRKRDRGKGQTSYQKPGPPTPIKNGGRRSLQGGELMSPRAALREINDGARAKVSTPSRIRALFSNKSKRDENSPMTPKGRRLSLFRKAARGRDDC